MSRHEIALGKGSLAKKKKTMDQAILTGGVGTWIAGESDPSSACPTFSLYSKSRGSPTYCSQSVSIVELKKEGDQFYISFSHQI